MKKKEYLERIKVRERGGKRERVRVRILQSWSLNSQEYDAIILQTSGTYYDVLTCFIRKIK